MSKLSRRRREVLELVAKGLTNAEIASVLGISEGTARTHVSALLRELDASNRTEAAALYEASTAGASAPPSSEEFFSRPTVAVLPLETGSGDDGVSHAFAVGISDELIGLFCRYALFPVIARSSTLDTPVGNNRAEVARALGAAFLVTGRVHRAGPSLQVHVFVDDVQRGECLWWERCELDAREVFAVQSSVCERIVARIYPHLLATAAAGALPRGSTVTPSTLSSWEMAQHGLLEYARRSPEGNAVARERFEQALAKDPTLFLAHYGRCLTFYQDVQNQWAERERTTARMERSVEEAAAIAPSTAALSFLRGRLAMAQGEFGASIPHYREAVRLNPSFAEAYAALGHAKLVALGDGTGLDDMRDAARLSPFAHVSGLATALFVHGDSAEALEVAEHVLATRPAYSFARMIAVTSAVETGDHARGRLHLEQLIDHNPEFRPSTLAASFPSQYDSVKRILSALRELGLDN